MQSTLETQTNKTEKILIQGRVGHMYDLIDLGDNKLFARFNLVSEVGMLDDNDEVQTEVLSFMVNAFDEVAREVNDKLHLNDEVLVMGTTTENEDQASTSSKNQIIVQKFRLISQ